MVVEASCVRVEGLHVRMCVKASGVCVSVEACGSRVCAGVRRARGYVDIEGARVGVECVRVVRVYARGARKRRRRRKPSVKAK